VQRTRAPLSPVDRERALMRAAVAAGPPAAEPCGGRRRRRGDGGIGANRQEREDHEDGKQPRGRVPTRTVHGRSSFCFDHVCELRELDAHLGAPGQRVFRGALKPTEAAAYPAAVTCAVYEPGRTASVACPRASVVTFREPTTTAAPETASPASRTEIVALPFPTVARAERRASTRVCQKPVPNWPDAKRSAGPDD